MNSTELRSNCSWPPSTCKFHHQNITCPLPPMLFLTGPNSHVLGGQHYFAGWSVHQDLLTGKIFQHMVRIRNVTWPPHVARMIFDLCSNSCIRWPCIRTLAPLRILSKIDFPTDSQITSLISRGILDPLHTTIIISNPRTKNGHISLSVDLMTVHSIQSICRTQQAQQAGVSNWAIIMSSLHLKTLQIYRFL